MADFDDIPDDNAPAQVKPAAVAPVPSAKSALRRKVVGRGQTSLSSRSPMILPGNTKPTVPSKSVSDLGIAKVAVDEPVKEAPEAEPVVAAAPVTAPAPAPIVAEAAPELAPKRGVGRPRKIASAAPPAAPAKIVAAKRPIAKPSLAKPIVAKPHPIEPTAKPVAAKAPRIKAAIVSPAAPAISDRPVGKVATAVAAASRPALRAARIINSVSTPSTTPPSGTSIKDLTMDMSANFNGFQGAMSEAQAKAQAAFEKSSNMMGEAGDFAKGNVEAMVEASKIFAEGVQEIGSTLVAESRTAFESMTGDIKELAAAKSPTDFLKMQSDLVRKNFDTAVSYSSKSSETFLKLMSDAFAPLSGRVSLAVEKARQVAPMSAPTNIAA